MSTHFAGRFEDKYVRVDGLRLHYTDWGGQKDAPSVLLVHGLNVQLHTWDPVADLLRDEFRVYCVDLRGHGDSDWAKEGYPVQAFVADIYEFARQVGMIPFAYVGHSLGARIGIAYAGEHPETVRHLLLSDTGPEVPREAALQVRDLVGSTAQIRGFRNEQEALEHYRKVHPEWRPIFHELHVEYQLRRNWAGKLVFKADPELYWINGSAGLREVPYIWETATRITAPTLIMWGERSALLTEEIIKRMMGTIPNARVARFSTGHYIPREQPEQFAEAVRAFVRG